MLDVPPHEITKNQKKIPDTMNRAGDFPWWLFFLNYWINYRIKINKICMPTINSKRWHFGFVINNRRLPLYVPV
jgi:hypothetical protein